MTSQNHVGIGWREWTLIQEGLSNGHLLLSEPGRSGLFDILLLLASVYDHLKLLTISQLKGHLLIYCSHINFKVNHHHPKPFPTYWQGWLLSGIILITPMSLENDKKVCFCSLHLKNLDIIRNTYRIWSDEGSRWHTDIFKLQILYVWVNLGVSCLFFAKKCHMSPWDWVRFLYGWHGT